MAKSVVPTDWLTYEFTRSTNFTRMADLRVQSLPAALSFRMADLRVQSLPK